MEQFKINDKSENLYFSVTSLYPFGQVSWKSSYLECEDIHYET